ncbi:MAG: hypothetical protein OXE05_09250 [Chloroflexi bacterium]|nr:hypothetical protein [Chloroflexota bacterium]
MIDINWNDPLAVVISLLIFAAGIIGLVYMVIPEDDGDRGDSDIHNLAGDE